MNLFRTAPRRLRNRLGRSGGRVRIGPLHGARRAGFPGGHGSHAAGSTRFQSRRAAWKGPGSVSSALPLTSRRVELVAGRRRPRRRTCPTPVRPRALRAGVGSSGARSGRVRLTSIRYRIDGRVSRLRAYFVWSDPQAEQALSSRGPPPLALRSPPSSGAPNGGVDESIVRADPLLRVGGPLRRRPPHGRDGTLTRPRQSAAIVRGDRALPRARATAGTTSATTSSSTSTARSSRAEGAADRRTSSARTPRASTPAATGVAVLGNYESTEDLGSSAWPRSSSSLRWRLDVGARRPARQARPGRPAANPQYPAGTTVTSADGLRPP